MQFYVVTWQRVLRANRNAPRVYVPGCCSHPHVGYSTVQHHDVLCCCSGTPPVIYMWFYCTISHCHIYIYICIKVMVIMAVVCKFLLPALSDFVEIGYSRLSCCCYVCNVQVVVHYMTKNLKNKTKQNRRCNVDRYDCR